MKKRNFVFGLIFVSILFVSISVYAADNSCTGIFTPELINSLRDYVYKPIKYATPVILIVFTALDFAKLVLSGTKEGLDKAKKNFLKRALAAIIIFFAPNIIELIVDAVNQQSIKSCLENFK